MNEAIGDLYREMGEQSLPAPPVPDVVADEIRKVGEHQWGTEEFDAKEQYLHHRHVDELIGDERPHPLWLFGYWGHGANSYAYSLTCRLGPLLLAMQGLWVPWEIYNDPVADAGELAELFQVARTLVQIASERQGPTRVLVDASRFRGGCVVRSMTTSSSGGTDWSEAASGSDEPIGSLRETREMAMDMLIDQEPQV